jgi:hypothetical protein
MPVKLNADVIESFAGVFLSTRYDNPRPTPPFHRECWALYASDDKQCEVVAPRSHAKSTGLTFAYILAEVCFRVSDYVILIGSTEDKAAEQLSNISEELHTNEDLRREFGIVSFESDQKTEIIVVHDDGHRFRILARGSEQKIRGAMWKGKRPNLIVCDDMEDDEQVENIERRKKFRRWFFRAVVPALSKSGKIRVHGTILHDDSLLARLRKNKTWKCLFYKAHESYSDFSNILWPEQWNAIDLRKIQQSFEAEGDSAGYSQEYLNTPRDNEEAFLRKQDFLPMSEEDWDAKKIYYAGADFAVSKKDKANRTSFTVGGQGATNLLCVVDHRVDRWDSIEWIQEIFSIDAQWGLRAFFVEDGVIWKSVYPMIETEMRKRDHYINFIPLLPVKDKGVRGQPYRKRMRAGGIHFDKQAEWYPSFEDENLAFIPGKDAILDDQFDSAATLCLGIEKEIAPEEDDDIDGEDDVDSYEMYLQEQEMDRNAVTGY